jgi:hypothetical protein
VTEGTGPVKSGNLQSGSFVRCQILRVKPRDEEAKTRSHGRVFFVPLLRGQQKNDLEPAARCLVYEKS